jgi:hypothetical protein
VIHKSPANPFGCSTEEEGSEKANRKLFHKNIDAASPYKMPVNFTSPVQLQRSVRNQMV